MSELQYIYLVLLVVTHRVPLILLELYFLVFAKCAFPKIVPLPTMRIVLHLFISS